MRNFFSIVLLLCTFSVCYAFDTEKIEDFRSNIVVNKNASLDITENIYVYANGDQIKRGIVRRLPINYKDSYGVDRHTRYQITEVLVNGTVSPYFIKTENEQFAIYIGQKDIDLSPGYYTYTIRYHVMKAINFLSDGDELYWNITGNQWNFPINHAEANIMLPDQASIINYHGYTGYKGEKGSDFSVAQPEPNHIIFTTTRPLYPDAGLTIAVAWQKGLITPPGFFDDVWLSPAQNVVIGLAILLFIYFITVWNRHGRDPRAGTIIPLFEPPLDLSPAAMRFISRMGADKKTLSAAIVSMATKSYLSIHEIGGVFKLEKSNTKGQPLAKEESAAAGALFQKAPSITLQQANYSDIQEADNQLKETLKEEYVGKYFITNTKYLVFGILLGIAALVIAILSADNVHDAFFAGAWITGWSIGCVMLAMQALSAISGLFYYFTFKNLWNALFFSVFTLFFLGAQIGAIFAFADMLPVSIILALIAIVVMDAVFYVLLKAPTPEGRKLMDQIAGFKLFLNTTERFRLEQFNPPEKTPAMFERYLPYAIALNIENSWGRQFEGILKAAGQDPSTYHPAWYSGRALNAAAISSFPSMLTSGLSSAISSASVSTSSSASGGGGSSGGGGGGGGGGGW